MGKNRLIYLCDAILFPSWAHSGYGHDFQGQNQHTKNAKLYNTALQSSGRICGQVFPCLVPDLELYKFLPASQVKAGWIGWLGITHRLESGKPEFSSARPGNQSEAQARQARQQARQTDKARWQSGRKKLCRKGTRCDCVCTLDLFLSLLGRPMGVENIEVVQSI